MTGLISGGGRGVMPWFEGRIYPWLELANGERFDARKEGLEADLINLISSLVPSGGHLMLEYESSGQSETHRELLLRVPPAATHLGALMFAAGFRGHFKDWYISQGGHEGPRKLQANKSPNTAAAREALRHDPARIERGIAKDEIADAVVLLRPRLHRHVRERRNEGELRAGVGIRRHHLRLVRHLDGQPLRPHPVPGTGARVRLLLPSDHGPRAPAGLRSARRLVHLHHLPGRPHRPSLACALRRGCGPCQRSAIKPNGARHLSRQQYLSRLKLWEGPGDLFETRGIDEELQKLLKPKIVLPSGGYLIIEHTEALTVIDVNTGKFTGGRNLEDTLVRTNIEAAAEIARQVRLRDIGGIIVCDFIDMNHESSRTKVLQTLEAGLRKDRTRTTIQSFSALGLLEFTRKRVGKDLASQLRGACPTCRGLGSVMSPESVAIGTLRSGKNSAPPGTPVLVEVSPTVGAQLDFWYEGEKRALEAQINASIAVRADASIHPEHSRVKPLEAELDAKRKRSKKLATDGVAPKPAFKVGDEIEVRGPIGGFFVWDGDTPALLIGGGSGIVPLMAMMRHRSAAGSDVPVRLLYSSRSPEDTIYGGELDRLATTHDGLEVIHTFTRTWPPGWTGYHRRIDVLLLEEVAWPPGMYPLVYICGSTQFVETAAAGLVQLGHDPVRVKTERFGPTGG